MIKAKFEPVSGRCGDILNYLMSSEIVRGFSEDLQFKIRLCAEEIVDNIISYAYDDDGFIELLIHFEDGVFTMTFKDIGIEFNPLAKPDPNVDLPVEERPVGGLGIFLCKQMMDEVSYEYKDNMNILSLSIKVNLMNNQTII